jgi:hypothetical protein
VTGRRPRRGPSVDTVVLPRGLGVRGRDFYVFEEDFRQALDWSSELARVPVAAVAPPLLAPGSAPPDSDQCRRSAARASSGTQGRASTPR